MPNVDRNVNNLNGDVFAALKQVKDPKNMSATEAQNIRRAIAKDGVIDAAEKDLILELTQDNNKNINISTQNNSNFNPSNLNFDNVSGQAKAILKTVTDRPNLNALWDGGANEFKQLVDLYDNVPGASKAIDNIAIKKLLDSWNKSNLLNGYQPLRQEISNVYNKVNNADPETKEKSMAILYRAAQRLDDYLKGAIPNFIYEGLAPAKK